MKNIEKILADFGIEIPEDKVADLVKEVNANYKTIAEFEKKDKLIESLKAKADDAATTLEKFKDIDPEQIRGEVDAWKKKAEDAEKEYASKLYDRDFADALEKAMADVKFTSNSAKAAVEKQIKESGITLKDGKLIGFNDILESIKTSDKDAFVDEEAAKAEESKVKFTSPIKDSKPSKMTRESIMAIKDNAERRKAISENPDLFLS